MTNQKDIFSYLVPGKCAHLAGIGGVSMSPLAEVLHGMGLKVQGSDMNDGPSVEHLRSLGIRQLSVIRLKLITILNRQFKKYFFYYTTAFDFCQVFFL